MNDEYVTIRGEVRTEIKVRNSCFVGVASAVITTEDAQQFIARIKQDLFDATHHCYAYRLGTDTFRYNDGGEPSGTAGKPILAAIERLNLADLVIVVARYFGGTKLGTGGLARAYGEAADRTLEAAQLVTKHKIVVISASFPHSQIGRVMHVVSKAEAKITETAYDEEVHLTLEVRQSRKEDLRTELIRQTSGNIRFT